MFEKVNPAHPDKVADRIAGAIVDLAYSKELNPKVAVEVLIGHDNCLIINETSVHIDKIDVSNIVYRIVGKFVKFIEYVEIPQDKHLADNQKDKLRCGDNGVFKGTPVTDEQHKLLQVAHKLYDICESDGKYVIDKDKLIICQSNVTSKYLKEYFNSSLVKVNPLGDWTGGINVDTGATNRKLGSDMGDSITGGGLHGKDLSKADVSVNIYCWLLAQKLGKSVETYCAIGDDYIYFDGNAVSYAMVVEVAREFIKERGGFEKFAEWGLIND